MQKKAKKACLTEAALIRLLLRGYEPREKPDERFYDAMRELSAIGKHIFERLIIFGRIFGVGGLFRIGRIVQYLTEPDAYLPKLCYCHFNPLFSGRRNSRSIAA